MTTDNLATRGAMASAMLLVSDFLEYSSFSTKTSNTILNGKIATIHNALIKLRYDKLLHVTFLNQNQI